MVWALSLRLGRVGHDGVGRGEAVQARHVVAGVHVDRSQAVARQVVLVPRVAPVGDGLRRCGAEGAEEEVAGGAAADDSVVASDPQAGAAEVAGVEDEEAVVGAGGVAADAGGDGLPGEGVGGAGVGK